MMMCLGSETIYEHMQTTHPNSAVEMLLQTGVQSTRSNMLLELTVQLLSEPAFNTLRTNEQLGMCWDMHIVFGQK
jgi:secreted Zn-dependent insulinase-like peptidase